MSEDVIRRRAAEIQGEILARSQHVREPDFKAIHPRDLELLFDAYDQHFFEAQCRRALDGRKLGFRLSKRMTKAGGTTSRFRSRTGEISFEIAIGTNMLFESFGTLERRVTVCGLECGSRLEALQRVFEHEMVHLVENLCWGNTECSASRFQDVAKRFFLHRAHTHNLITRAERAAAIGIRRGSRVAFSFEGRRLTGRVNRVTRRATVLVEDPEGALYSNGLRYKTYYVPIGRLEVV